MTTYIDIVNKLCRRTNEVQIASDQFDTAFGVHGAFKDGIIDTLDQLYQHKYKWPFLAVQKTQILTPGVQQYAWESDFLSVDWKSFELLKDDALGVRHRFLDSINREEWYRYGRDDDYDSTATQGRNLPLKVFNDHGMGWGVTPNPDQAYSINYKYFKNPVRPSVATDEIALPTQYEYVLIQGGLMHAYIFYDNNERSQIAEKRRDDGIVDMANTLLGNQAEHMYAGQIDQPRRNTFWRA
jgi:hypothetical protein